LPPGHQRNRPRARGRRETASASRSCRRSSCFWSATETRSAWSIAQLL